jgi:hypothetical protein
MLAKDRPCCNTGRFSIQTLSIILFNTIFETSRVILKGPRISDSCAPKCLPLVTKTVNADGILYCWERDVTRPKA